MGKEGNVQAHAAREGKGREHANRRSTSREGNMHAHAAQAGKGTCRRTQHGKEKGTCKHTQHKQGREEHANTCSTGKEGDMHAYAAWEGKGACRGCSHHGKEKGTCKRTQHGQREGTRAGPAHGVWGTLFNMQRTEVVQRTTAAVQSRLLTRLSRQGQRSEQFAVVHEHSHRAAAALRPTACRTGQGIAFYSAAPQTHGRPYHSGKGALPQGEKGQAAASGAA